MTSNVKRWPRALKHHNRSAAAANTVRVPSNSAGCTPDIERVVMGHIVCCRRLPGGACARAYDPMISSAAPIQTML